MLTKAVYQFPAAVPTYLNILHVTTGINFLKCEGWIMSKILMFKKKGKKNLSETPIFFLKEISLVNKYFEIHIFCLKIY